MNTYDAIMAAADHIERYPRSYDFHAGGVVRGNYPGLNSEQERFVRDHYGDGGYPCCMLARIGYYTDGHHAGYDDVARTELRVSEPIFYERIMRITAGLTGADRSNDAILNPRHIPAAMREYAREYHGIPQAVRDIFVCGTVEKAMAHAG